MDLADISSILLIAVLTGAAAGVSAVWLRSRHDLETLRKPVMRAVERALDEYRDERAAQDRSLMVELDGILESVEGAATRAKRERQRAVARENRATPAGGGGGPQFADWREYRDHVERTGKTIPEMEALLAQRGSGHEQ